MQKRFLDLFLHYFFARECERGGKMKKLTIENRRDIEKMWGEGASPVEISAKVGICQATTYVELKRGQVYDEEGKEVMDDNFRPKYSAERGQAVYLANVRRRGRRSKAEKMSKGV